MTTSNPGTTPLGRKETPPVLREYNGERWVRVRRCVHDVKADICAEPCGTCGHRCCDHDPDGGCGMWPEDDPQMTDDDRADAEADGRLERRREDEQERRQGAREA